MQGRHDARTGLFRELAWGIATGIAAGLLLLLSEAGSVAWAQLVNARALLDWPDLAAGCFSLVVVFAWWGAAVGVFAGGCSWLVTRIRRRPGRAWGLALLFLGCLVILARDAVHAWYPTCPWQGPLLFWGLFPLLALLLTGAIFPLLPRLARAASGHPLLGTALLLPVVIGIYWILDGRDACRRLEEQIAAAVPVPARGTATLPNMILISLDTVRADALGCYGNGSAITPNLDRLAAQGIRFTDLSTPLPSTRPAHTTMLTGLVPEHHRVVDNLVSVVSRSLVTLAETLQAQGYATGAFVSAEVLTGRAGLDQGFSIYDDCFAVGHRRLRMMPVVPRCLTLLRPTLRWLGDGMVASNRPGTEALDHGLAWMDRVRSGPFFLFLHFYDAHAPYDCSPKFQKRFLRPGESPAEMPFDEQHVEFWRRMYAAGVCEVDSLVGEVMAAVERAGLADHTLLVVTADHGESFGNDYYYDHSERVFESVVRIPLLARFPGRIPAGTVDDRMVSLADLTPTILDWMAVAPPSPIDGRSFAHSGPARTELYASSRFRETMGWRPEYVSYRRGSRKWIENVATGEVTEEPVSIPAPAADSAAARPGGDDRVSATAMLERYLDDVVTQAKSPAAIRMEVDEGTRERMRALGYVE